VSNDLYGLDKPINCDGTSEPDEPDGSSGLNDPDKLSLSDDPNRLSRVGIKDTSFIKINLNFFSKK